MSQEDQTKILLQQIIERLDHLDNRLTHIERSTLNMDHHISFVENIYDTVKLPFHSLMGLVNNMSLSSSTPSPSIDQSHQTKLLEDIKNP